MEIISFGEHGPSEQLALYNGAISRLGLHIKTHQF